MTPIRIRILLKIVILEHKKLDSILLSQLKTRNSRNEAECENCQQCADKIIDTEENRESEIIQKNYEALLKSLKRPVPWKSLHEGKIERKRKQQDYLHPEKDHGYDHEK